MSEHIKPISDADFEADILQSDLPVLVDFWAPWCGPCKMIAPVLEEVASEFSGKLHVYKMNVDENTQTPAKYGIRGIPSLLYFKGGNMVDTHVGALTKSQLAAFIEKNSD